MNVAPVPDAEEPMRTPVDCSAAMAMPTASTPPPPVGSATLATSAPRRTVCTGPEVTLSATRMLSMIAAGTSCG